MSNVIPLDYPSILQQRIAAGEITWQEAFNWLQSQGMSARIAKTVLGKEGQLSSVLKAALDTVE